MQRVQYTLIYPEITQIFRNRLQEYLARQKGSIVKIKIRKVFGELFYGKRYSIIHTLFWHYITSNKTIVDAKKRKWKLVETGKEGKKWRYAIYTRIP